MATLYWGPSGGSSTGTWDLTTTTNWFTNVGRTTPAAAAPTAVDDVVFDASSDASAIFTVTIGASGAVCRDVTISGLDQVMTLAGAGALDIYGSMSLPATNLTRTFTGVITFRATTTGKTILTNGVSLVTGSNLVFDGVGGEWTLSSALTSSNVTITNGSFVSGNQAITANGGLISSNTNVRSISLGSTTFTSGGASPIQLATITNLTWNAGTSLITLSGASPTFASGGLTFNNVSFTSNAAGTVTINGANTFNNLTFTSRAATGLRLVSLGADQIVSGALTFGTANTVIRRMFIFSSTIGTQRTITLNGSLATIADVDFRDIKAAGTVARPWTGTRIGNCLGNDATSITFTTPKTVYWNLAGSQSWSATGWALTNNGAPGANNFPLAQDTATFTQAGAAGTVTLDNSWQIGPIQMADGVSNRSTAFTLATSTQTPSIYGNVTLFASLSLSGTGNITFYNPSGTTILTLANIAFTQPITLSAGGLNITNQTFTCLSFNTSNANTRSIIYGTTGKIVLTGGNWTATTSTNLTYTGTGTIDMTFASAKIFAGGGASYPTLNQGGAGALSITGANTFTNITNTVQPATITFPSSTTTTLSALTVAGTAGNLITLNSSTVGVQATLSDSSGTVAVSYISIKDINATGGAGWNAYTSLGNIDSGNNSGWVFDPAPSDVTIEITYSLRSFTENRRF